MHCTVPVPKDDCSFLLLRTTKYIMYLAGRIMKTRHEKRDILGQILKFSLLGAGGGGSILHYLISSVSCVIVPS